MTSKIDDLRQTNRLSLVTDKDFISFCGEAWREWDGIFAARNAIVRSCK
jgi:hypothetical protein